MQVLYAMNRDAEVSLNDGLQRYRQSVAKSFDLYLFNLLLIYKISAHALKEYDLRKNKLLPTEEDKFFTPMLWENPLIQSLHQNAELEKMWKNKGLLGRIDQDNIRLFYNEVIKTEEYKEYTHKKDLSLDDHRDMLLSLFKTCLKNESYLEFLDDNFNSWNDDESLIIGAVKKTIKAMPVEGKFFEEYLPDTEATEEFGEELLRLTVQRDKDLLETIEPTLQNWDAERVAVLDMVMLKMAVCELLYFPTIPTKVTLNEFVEISKLYSTDKSKDFINGILDRLMKSLLKDGKIKKEGRGLLE